MRKNTSYVKSGKILAKLGLQISEIFSLQVSEVSSILNGEISLVALSHLLLQTGPNSRELFDHFSSLKAWFDGSSRQKRPLTYTQPFSFFILVIQPPRASSSLQIGCLFPRT